MTNAPRPVGEIIAGRPLTRRLSNLFYAGRPLDHEDAESAIREISKAFGLTYEHKGKTDANGKPRVAGGMHKSFGRTRAVLTLVPSVNITVEECKEILLRQRLDSLRAFLGEKSNIRVEIFKPTYWGRVKQVTLRIDVPSGKAIGQSERNLMRLKGRVMRAIPASEPLENDYGERILRLWGEISGEFEKMLGLHRE
jgi:hypothetical protein